MNRDNRTGAFTLVELLVVVAIIVILIAMLIPAVDRAKYQALLAICGTRLKGTATGVTQYAAGNKRFYPARTDLYMGNTLRSFNGAMDLRPVLIPYMSLNMLLDPLCDKIDISPEVTNARNPNEMVMANISIRFAWKFPGESAMNKLGDLWTWTDNKSPGGPRNYRFSLIAHDDDREYSKSSALTSHPDSLGKLGVYLDTTETPAPGTNHPWVISRWQGDYRRGGMDMNYSYADGSVIRHNNVTANDPFDSPSLDDRMARIANYGSETRDSWTGAEWHNIPKR